MRVIRARNKKAREKGRGVRLKEKGVKET